MANLLRQNSETDGSDDADEEGGTAKKTPLANEGRKKRKRDDSLAGNIAVLAFACWTLRVPVMYMDFIK